MAPQQLFPRLQILGIKEWESTTTKGVKELKDACPQHRESVRLGRELASRSKFGQDLAAPAACQRHLSPQPVPLPVLHAIQCQGPRQPAQPRGVPACKQAAPPQREGILTPTRQIPAALCLRCRTGCGEQERGGGGSCQKKPMARLADPRHSAQTHFPFYFGNVRQLSLGDKRPQAGSCSSAQHLPEHPGMENQHTPSAASSSQGRWEPTLLEIPAMWSAATLPHSAAQQHRLAQRSVLEHTGAHCRDGCLGSQAG